MRYLILVLLAACGPLSTDEKTNPFGEGDFDIISINNPYGNIQVTTSATPAVVASFSWRGDESPTMNTRLTGSTLLVSSACPETARRCAVDFTIQVPENTEVDASGQIGEITINGVGGAVDASLSEGTITLTDVGGNARVNLPTGDVFLNGGAGRLDVNVIEGSINGAGMENSTSDIVLEEGNVAIEYDAQPDLIQVRVGEGEINVRVPNATYDVIANTAKGDTQITGLTNAAGTGNLILCSSDKGNIVVEGK